MKTLRIFTDNYSGYSGYSGDITFYPYTGGTIKITESTYPSSLYTF